MSPTQTTSPIGYSGADFPNLPVIELGVVILLFQGGGGGGVADNLVLKRRGE